LSVDFGFTNDQARYAAAIAWRDAAIADGWSARATYGNSESFDRASSLDHADGYKVMILTRTNDKPGAKWKFEAEVNVWGPDGLAIKPPAQYDMTAIRAATETCHYCGKVGRKTERVGFAGRACMVCAPVEEKKLGPNYYK
jgi:hypothetical protein